MHTWKKKFSLFSCERPAEGWSVYYKFKRQFFLSLTIGYWRPNAFGIEAGMVGNQQSEPGRKKKTKSLFWQKGKKSINWKQTITLKTTSWRVFWGHVKKKDGGTFKALFLQKDPKNKKVEMQIITLEHSRSELQEKKLNR